MIKNLQGKSRFFLFFLLTIIFVACEQEDRFVGAGIFNLASFNRSFAHTSATTLPSDTIRSDRSILNNTTAILGVFDEPIFGKTKADFYTQVRLSNLSPNFGGNPVVDSVVLFIPALSFETADTIQTQRILKETIYSLNTSNDACTVSDTTYRFEVRRLFKIDSVYGHTQTPMTLNVHRVVEPMRSVDSAFYSNKSFAVGELFGSTTISNQFFKNSNVRYSNIEGTENADVISDDSVPMLRINLQHMVAFAQENIVNQSSGPNMRDNASFVRNVLQGIRLGVSDENGFLLNFAPSQLRMVLYYSQNNPNFVDTNGNGVHDGEENCPVVVTRPRISNTYELVVGGVSNAVTSSFNVQQSHIVHSGGSVQSNIPNAARVYVQGMGGNKVKIRIDDAQLAALRDSVNQRDWLITQAQLKLYPDLAMQGNLPLPNFLYAYNYTDKSVLPDYGGTANNSSSPAFPFNQISLPYNPETGHYSLRITEFVKNMIEEGAPNKELAIEMGNYLAPSTAFYYTPRNAYFSNRISNPFRLVLIGSHPESALEDKRIQLEVFYNKR